MNCNILAKISIQELLMKILKRTINSDYQKQISMSVGWISSTHSNSKHIQTLMRNLIKKSKYANSNENYFQCQLKTLIDCISGKNRKNIFYFSGIEEAYIELNPSLLNLMPGLFWTGYIRYEAKNENRQCIISFINIENDVITGIELYIENRTLIYKILNIGKGDETFVIPMNTISITENYWHHIAMAHIGELFRLHVDGSRYSTTIHSISLPKKYKRAIIGAAIDKTNKLKDHFFGEMSKLYFFEPSSKHNEIIETLACKSYKKILSDQKKNFLNVALVYAPPETAVGRSSCS